MKTYKAQHLVFKTRYFIALVLNRDFLTISNYFRHRAITQIVTLFSIDTRSKSIVNIRYFYKSKNFREAFWQAKNGKHSRVIDTINSIPDDQVTTQMDSLLRRSLQALNLHSEILKNQEHITDEFITSLPEQTHTAQESEYKSLVKSGMNQAGIIVETNDGINKKITKVKNFYSHPIKYSTEDYFYKFLSVGKLEKFIPKFYDFKELNKKGFLTIEYVHGRTPQESDIQKVLEFQKEIFQINYQHLKSLKSMKPVFPYILFNPLLLDFGNKQVLIKRINQIVVYLSSVHSMDKDQNTALLKNVYLTPPIYDLIDFKKDLVLQHRDFSSHNSFITNANNLMVFDWESYGLGIPGTDILKFMYLHSVDFEEIQNTLFGFIQKENINNYDVICAYLTLNYLSFLTEQENNNKKEANVIKAIQFLSSSPLNS